MFICEDQAPYLEATSNHSKFCNVKISLKMIKNVVKVCLRLILHKINKNKMQKKQEWNVLYIRRDGVIYVKFKTLQLHNFEKFHPDTTKLCERFFLYKIYRIWNLQGKLLGWNFGLRSTVREVIFVFHSQIFWTRIRLTFIAALKNSTGVQEQGNGHSA